MSANANQAVRVTYSLVPFGIDGVSIAPTLTGNGQQRRREFIIHKAGNGQSIIRGNYKLVRSKGSALRLYDLELSGHGAINGDVFNYGMFEVTGGNPSTLRVRGDYHQAESAELKLTIADNKPAVSVPGETKLADFLAVTLARGFTPVAGTSYTVLTADQITGTFDNPHGEVAGSDGSRFSISYSTSAVTLRMKERCRKPCTPRRT